MKKYLITEQQLSLIIEAADKMPGKNEYKGTPELSFGDFVKSVQQNPNRGPEDTNKLYSIGQMGSSRAEFYGDRAQSSLDKIAGKFNKRISSYIKSDDSILKDAQELSAVVLGLLFYLYNEGAVKKQYVPQDVRYRYNAAYKYLKDNNLSKIQNLVSMNVSSKWVASVNPNDNTETIISSEMGSIQIHVDMAKDKTKFVKFNYIDSAVLDYFYNQFLKTGDNLEKIRVALHETTIRPTIQTGSLVFTY